MLTEKVGKLLERLADVEKQLSEPEILQDQKKFKQLSQEHAYLSQVKQIASDLNVNRNELRDQKELQKLEKDPEFLAVLEEEIPQLEAKIESLSSKLEELLVPPDPNDHANTIIEIRAGTGGDEAALFVADCARMYKLFAEHQGWKWELLSHTETGLGGFKDFVMVIQGQNAYRFMKYEAGTHRVQRIPDTETQGRVHTSAVTMAVLMEPEEDEDFKIDEKELRIDTMRASGAGGQHVNTTDSAVRITHLPTGLVAACQEERSQHKNREKAMRVLKAKIKEDRDRKKQAAISSTRALQVGSGDRSERIRTYNFPQNRVTDHRIGLTSHNLHGIMDGDLLEISSALVKHFHQKKLQGD